MKEVKAHLGDDFEKSHGDCQGKFSGEDKDDDRCGDRRPGSPGDGFEDRALFCFILQSKNPFLIFCKMRKQAIYRGEYSFAYCILLQLFSRGYPTDLFDLSHKCRNKNRLKI